MGCPIIALCSASSHRGSQRLAAAHHSRRLVACGESGRRGAPSEPPDWAQAQWPRPVRPVRPASSSAPMTLGLRVAGGLGGLDAAGARSRAR